MEHLNGDDKQLFCDEDFPASRKSLFQDPDSPDNVDMDFTWKRPREMCEDPQMFVAGAHRGDVIQGIQGDCWFLIACSAITQVPDLINRVIPPDQVLDGEGYTGKLTFRFWSMGDWVTIYIDDRLAMDDDGALVYSKCVTKNEFWLPLLEKAFAKFHGNYEILDGGHLVEGFVNLTGFLVENVEIKDHDRNKLYRRLRLERKHNSLLTCSRASQYTQGLIGDHGYTITDLKKLEFEGKMLRMVRVRNPWGGQEWTGAWSDGDSRWLSVKQDVRDEFEYNRTEDGEFWMKFSHFTDRFLEVCIATPTPDMGDSYKNGAANKMFVIHDSWIAGENAGGSQNDVASFATNSQYLLTVEEEDDPDSEVDDDDDEDTTINGDTNDTKENGKASKTCRVLVDLIQEHRRKKHCDLYSIAVFVIKTHKEKRLSVGDLQEIDTPVAHTDYESISSVMCHADLAVGQKYIILPATFEPNQERKFLLRIYSRKPVKVVKLPA